MNGSLSAGLHEPLYAALWSFGSGWVVLTGVLLASRRTRAGLAAILGQVRHGGLRAWQSLGGVLGATFVLVQSYAVPLAGVALFTIAVVGGQTGTGLLVDRLGLGPSGRAPVTVLRVLAAVVATVGVVVAVSGRAVAASLSVLVPVVLSLVVGGLIAVQSAINGRVNVVSGTPWATTWLNFTTGVSLLAAVAVARTSVGSLGSGPSLPGSGVPWWVWWGGLAGVVVVGVGVVVVRYLGVLRFMLVMLTGQLAGAVALDLANPATRHTVDAVVVAGLLVTAAGAALAAVRRPGGVTRRGRTPAAE